MTTDRRDDAYRIRVSAAEMARGRAPVTHLANGDEQRYRDQRYGMSFTKGLAHDPSTGLIHDRKDFEAFRAAIDNGFIDAFTAGVPVPRRPVLDGGGNPVTDADGNPVYEPRYQWEAPTAGVVFDLEGPDAQAVTMDPAPALGSDELTYEMAEVYELALLRDEALTGFAGTGSTAVKQSANRLDKLAYAKDGFPGRPRITDGSGKVTPQEAFRGSSPGVETGPYLSQFMLIGNADRAGTLGVADGRIGYGALTIDQRVPVAVPGQDYMQTEADWLHVQNGYGPVPGGPSAFTPEFRFISTPRDLATYVHFDALYEAYLNACLILLSMGAPSDPGFDALAGDSPYVVPSASGGSGIPRNAGGFALYSGPHVLTLVTEVATRALKAVRFQKFNNHIRLRPEALAGRIQFAPSFIGELDPLGAPLMTMADDIKQTLNKIEALNNGAVGTKTRLLPMAFAEGSPMHPAYGAGHATVAGACVTILKAFFDTSTSFVTPAGGGEPTFKHVESGDAAVAFTSNFGISGGTGDALVEVTDAPLLTLEGELNKLAANISIGRNMAGVHYFTDYYDSLRMGEEIAIGLLEEQALCYRTDPFVLSVPTFDGDVVRIGRR